ncbi:MAG TPA: NifB/NifX family molybdenum-iron cluster-binding protein [Deltaproteobacteria bacterium]|nr:NifB/NifX family molybdenum-iron cluster-binding protein [Deltaproteobacteria bacterium]
MKDTFKAAVGADALGDISCTHFGDSEAIVFVDISADGFTIVGKINNPLKQTDDEGHASRKKLESAKKMLFDVTFIISGKMSPNFKKMRLEKGKMPIVTTRPLDETLTHLAENLEDITAYFEDTKNIYLKV